MNKFQSESETTETELSGTDANQNELRFRGVIHTLTRPSHTNYSLFFSNQATRKKTQKNLPRKIKIKKPSKKKHQAFLENHH